MKKIKTLVATTVCLSTTYFAFAEESIVVTTNDGKLQYPLNETTEIVVGDDGLTFYTGAETGKMITYDEISSITFETSAGIFAQEAKQGNLTIRSAEGGQALIVEGIDTPKAADIYSTSGQLWLHIQGFEGGRIDVAQLPPGIFIIHIGSEAVKFVKK